MQILVRLVNGNDTDDIVDGIYRIVDECRVPKVTSYAEVNPVKLS